MASTNLPGKLGRAICHHLVTGAVISFDRTFPPGSRRVRLTSLGPIIAVELEEIASDENFPGNERFRVQISVKASASTDPNTPASNENTARIEFDALVGVVRDKMALSDDDGQSYLAACRAINTSAYAAAVAVDASAAAIQFAADNADLDDFTLLWITAPRRLPAPTEEAAWETLIEFEAVCCESKIGGYT